MVPSDLHQGLLQVKPAKDFRILSRGAKWRPWSLMADPMDHTRVCAFGPRGYSAFLSKLVSDLAGRYAETSTREHVLPYLEKLFAFFESRTPLLSALFSPPEIVRGHYEAYLESQGCKIKASPRRNRRRECLRSGKSRYRLMMTTGVMVNLYGCLDSFYGKQNPFLYDGCTGPVHYRSGGEWISDSGSQFLFISKPSEPPEIYDTTGLRNGVITQIKASGAPAPVCLAIRFLAQTGARGREGRRANILGWYYGSKFGLEFKVKNKGEDGKDYIKTVAIAPKLRDNLIKDIEMRHHRDMVLLRQGKLSGYVHPSMEQMRALATSEDGKGYLATLPLFPNAKGGFYSRSGLDYWFKPAVADIQIDGQFSNKPVTVHALRTAHISDALARMPSDLTAAQEKLYEQQEARRMRLKRTSTLRRYGAHPVNLRAVQRMREIALAVEGETSSDPSQPVGPPRPAFTFIKAALSRGTVT